jgi:hypothetical protein
MGVGAFGEVVQGVGGSLVELLQDEELRAAEPQFPLGPARREMKRAEDPAKGVDRARDRVGSGNRVPRGESVKGQGGVSLPGDPGHSRAGDAG